MTHQQAAQAVKNVTQYTIDFLARKHAVTRDHIVAGLLAGDAKLLAQWEQCFKWAAEQVQ